MAAESSKGIKQFKVPHVYAIIFALMVIFAVLTWIVPSGSYQRQEVNGREVTVAGTYEQSEKTYIDEETGDEVDLRQGVFDVLQAPTRGIQEAIEVVAFILIVGGSFQVITKTGAITSGMGRVVRRFKNKDILIIYSYCDGSLCIGRNELWHGGRNSPVLCDLHANYDGYGLRLDDGVHGRVRWSAHGLHRLND